VVQVRRSLKTREFEIRVCQIRVLQPRTIETSTMKVAAIGLLNAAMVTTGCRPIDAPDRRAFVTRVVPRTTLTIPVERLDLQCRRARCRRSSGSASRAVTLTCDGECVPATVLVLIHTRHA
jgi:hypothetical protein